ncbi:MAG: hypothetical protein K2J63_01895 [Muribaculaceae bacterium]|nr:hypothetical protein [Muribaculaceae bacterium]
MHNKVAESYVALAATLSPSIAKALINNLYRLTNNLTPHKDEKNITLRVCGNVKHFAANYAEGWKYPAV